MKGFKIVLVLVIVGILSGGSLAVVFGFANPLIKENRRRATEEAVRHVLPGTRKFETRKVKGLTIYRGMDTRGRLLGYAFAAERSGFQGKIQMMIGADAKLENITGLVILANVETPGLGNKIGEKSFHDRFIGLGLGEKIIIVKNEKADRAQNEVEAITGATISSRAVVDGANEEIAKVRKALASK